MIKIKITILLLLITIGATAQIKCLVKGCTINRPESTNLLLSKTYEDSSNGKIIPIKDATFEFVIEAEHPECYELTFEDEIKKGRWRSVTFCTTDGTVNMELYPMEEYRRNIIIGGDENLKMKRFQDFSFACKDSLLRPIKEQIMLKRQTGDFFSDAGKALNESFKNAPSEKRPELYRQQDKMERSGELFTSEVFKLMKQADSISLIVQRINEQYQFANMSLFDYAGIISNLSRFNSFVKYQYKGDGSALDYLADKVEKYAAAYPNHPYNKLSAELINNLRQISVGGHYIDFTAPDLDGRMVKLSEQINGKIAILDLWASWCGPCRTNSMSFKPIYEQYKDKGFTIIGVAREKKSDTAMRKAIEQDGYKWLNLIEMNDKAEIWLKYGIVNAAGGVYLIDRDGTILAKDPTAEDIRTILEQKIGAL